MSVEDNLTKFLRDVTKVPLAQHPLRLAGCVAAGLVLQATVSVAHSEFHEEAWLKTASELHLMYYIALAVLFGFFVVKPTSLSEQVQQQLQLIEQIIILADIKKMEAKQVWRKVLQKYIDQLSPELSKPKIGKELVSEAIKDSSPQ